MNNRFWFLTTFAKNCVKGVQIMSFFWSVFPVFGLNTDIYSVKNIHIRSFFWPVCSPIWTEYGNYCVKSVQIRSIFWSVFFSIWTMEIFGLNTEICSVNLCIQSKYRKIQTRKNSVFRHFLRIEKAPS